MAGGFVETRLPNQKSVDGILFPTVVSPSPDFNFNLSLLTESIKEQNPWFENLLHLSGAILLRGFPVNTASDFNEVVEAFGYDELPYVGGSACRTKIVGRVITANDAPPDQNIPFHHEMSYVPEFPSKLFFFCEEEPGSGGETPIVLSHLIYKMMREKYSDFVEKLEEHGLSFSRIVGVVDDPSSPYGRSWKSMFSTEDKRTAEERAARLGMMLEWIEDGVKVVMGPVPAVKFDQTRGRKIWFNSMARNVPINTLAFGDYTPLPDDMAEIIFDCLRILDEECVAIPWQKGDVLLLDNLAVLHSRRPFDPPRRILASLCK